MFLPFTFFLYFFLLSKRLVTGAKGFLVFASLFFYSWWNVLYLPLILSSMLFNYVIGNSLNKKSEQSKVSKKQLLLFGLASNLSLLGYFKYTDFFIENFNGIFGSDVPLLHIALPLAISFFTFQQIAYLVDSYRGQTKEYDFLNYALFVTFFPQLIAGPIVHHKEMMPQFANKWNLVKSYKNIALGIFIFSIGLFKKVVIADTFAVWATNGFDNAITLNLIEAWATSLSYTFQLYFDFSGYADMAIGLGLLFNIMLPINFNSPYKALNVIDFWSRWHMTLTRFLTTYIYEPIVRSYGKFSFNRAMFATVITMFLAGLWHGAAWTFVVFGLLHGFAIVLNHYWKKTKIKLPKVLAWFLTFNFLNLSFVIFRAKEWDDVFKIYSGMFSLDNVVLPEKYFKFLSSMQEHYFTYGDVYSTIGGKDNTTISMILAFILVLAFNSSYAQLKKFQSSVFTLLFTATLLLISLSMMSNVTEFLYFNF